MAELAGRVGDGFNAPATHPSLHDLISLARGAHASSGRDPDQFLVTVHTEFDERWLHAETPARANLASLRVDRLILDLSPPFDRGRIVEAGRLLGVA